MFFDLRSSAWRKFGLHDQSDSGAGGGGYARLEKDSEDSPTSSLGH